MKNLDLTDDKAQALVRVIREAIDSDRFPLSPRIAVLTAVCPSASAHVAPRVVCAADRRYPKVRVRKGMSGSLCK
jgi:DNA-binding transcriptional LysR family regulator